MEFQQSPLYAKYISSLGWQIIVSDGIRMFYRNIPFVGGLLKIQRPEKLPALGPMFKKYKIDTVAIDPRVHTKNYRAWSMRLGKHCRVVRGEYLPTKTICVDLTPSEEDIFKRFSEAKRRAVRKAVKNGVEVTESDDITKLIRIKNKSGGFLGFIATFGIDKFWEVMAPKHATIVLATYRGTLVGGVMVAFWKTTAMYWVAGASRQGKKLFAPTILVWEALKIAKRRGAKEFDFLGVWDERRPNEHGDWKGFTKFKEGFGGKTIYYPV